MSVNLNPSSMGRQLAALFDHQWYALSYMEGRQVSFAQAYRHFLEQGAEAGNNPHPLFLTKYYTSQLSRRERQGGTPLEHYLEKGASLGLSPFPLFDPAWYAEAYRPEQDGLTPFAHYLLKGIPEDLNPNSMFDVRWYKERHAEGVQQYGGFALLHYLLTASELRQDTGPHFSGSEYTWLYGIDTVNPLIHYLQHGRYDLFRGKIFQPDYSRVDSRTLELAAGQPKGKVVICTALTGDYSRLLPHTFINPDYRYVCFTDRERETWGVWDLLPFPWHHPDDPTRTSRYPKLNLPQFFPEADWLVWADANVIINGDIGKYIESVEKSGAPLGSLRHPFRDCIYEEAEICQIAGREDPEKIKAHIEHYRAQGFPAHAGLWENNFFIVNRRHEKAPLLFQAWWEEYSAHCKRDQLSLPYVLWKLGITPHAFLGEKCTRNHEDFSYLIHKETKIVKVPSVFPRRMKE